METTRQNKIARLLQKELSDIFLLQTKSMPGILISVSAGRISPDMSVARLSIFPEKKEEFKNIKKHKSIPLNGYPCTHQSILSNEFFQKKTKLLISFLAFRVGWITLGLVVHLCLCSTVFSNMVEVFSFKL